MSYVTLVFKIVELLVAMKIDQIIGKWVAYFSIAWQSLASAQAKAKFDAGINDVKLNMPDKAKQWDDWRKKAGMQ